MSCTINVTFTALTGGLEDGFLRVTPASEYPQPRSEPFGEGVATPTPPTPPTPGPPPPGDPGGEPVTLDLQAKAQKLKQKLAFFATVNADSFLLARGKAIKETTRQLAANQKTKVKAKLKRAVRKRLAKKLDKKGNAKAKVKGTATGASGSTATDAVKVKLKH